MQSKQEHRNFEIISENGLFKVKSLKYGFEDVGYFFEVTCIKELREEGPFSLVVKEYDDTYTIYWVEYFDNQGKPKEIKVHKVITDIEKYAFYNDSIFAIYMRGYFMFISPCNFGVSIGLRTNTKETISQRVLNLEKIPGEKISYESQFNNIQEGRYVFQIDETYYLIETKSIFNVKERQFDITKLGYAEPMDAYGCILVRDEDGSWYIHEGHSEAFNVDYMKVKKILPFSLKEMDEIEGVLEEKNARAYKLISDKGIAAISIFDADTKTFPAKFYEIVFDEPADELEFRKRVFMSEEKGDYIDFWTILNQDGRISIVVKNSHSTKILPMSDLI